MAGSPMNRASFRKELQLGLNTVFGDEYDRYGEEWRDAFEVDTSDKAWEEDVLVVGLGAAQVKIEGGPVAYDAGAEAWTARYIHNTIALAFSITEEAIEDNLYGDLGARYSRALARSMHHAKEIYGAAQFNNAFDSTNFPIGDGAAMCSTSHPMWGGGNQANRPTTDADPAEASLEDAMIQIAGWKDDRGIPIAAQARRVLIPKEQVFVLERLLESPLRPGTADNDINAIRSKNMIPEGYYVNHRFTDTNAWFIKTDVPDGLKHFVRKAMQRGMEGDFETGNLRYKARERYSFGITDWRGVWGTSGST